MSRLQIEPELGPIPAELSETQGHERCYRLSLVQDRVQGLPRNTQQPGCAFSKRWHCFSLNSVTPESIPLLILWPPPSRDDQSPAPPEATRRMLRMLDRYAIQKLLHAKVSARQIAEQFKSSVRTIRRIAREAAVEAGADAAGRAERDVGRPGVADAVRTARRRPPRGGSGVATQAKCGDCCGTRGTPVGLRHRVSVGRGSAAHLADVSHGAV